MSNDITDRRVQGFERRATILQRLTSDLGDLILVATGPELGELLVLAEQASNITSHWRRIIRERMIAWIEDGGGDIPAPAGGRYYMGYENQWKEKDRKALLVALMACDASQVQDSAKIIAQCLGSSFPWKITELRKVLLSKTLAQTVECEKVGRIKEGKQAPKLMLSTQQEQTDGHDNDKDWG